MSQSQRKRSSGTLTRAWLGSIVQKGKFSAGMPMRVRTLKSVDLPTLGRPTMPTWRGEEAGRGRGKVSERERRLRTRGPPNRRSNFVFDFFLSLFNCKMPNARLLLSSLLYERKPP